MNGYVLSPEAQDDVMRIEEYIARDNPPRAVSFVEEIIDCFRLLAANPKLGRACPEFTTPGVRSFVHGEYVIPYRSASHGVDIVRVPHGRRDLTKVL